jgi:hypothetical protein
VAFQNIAEDFFAVRLFNLDRDRSPAEPKGEIELLGNVRRQSKFEPRSTPDQHCVLELRIEIRSHLAVIFAYSDDADHAFRFDGDHYSE